MVNNGDKSGDNEEMRRLLREVGSVRKTMMCVRFLNARHLACQPVRRESRHLKQTARGIEFNILGIAGDSAAARIHGHEYRRPRLFANWSVG